jgi:hypothetical protein
VSNLKSEAVSCVKVSDKQLSQNKLRRVMVLESDYSPQKLMPEFLPSLRKQPGLCGTLRNRF